MAACFKISAFWLSGLPCWPWELEGGLVWWQEALAGSLRCFSGFLHLPLFRSQNMFAESHVRMNDLLLVALPRSFLVFRTALFFTLVSWVVLHQKISAAPLTSYGSHPSRVVLPAPFVFLRSNLRWAAQIKSFIWLWGDLEGSKAEFQMFGNFFCSGAAPFSLKASGISNAKKGCRASWVTWSLANLTLGCCDNLNYTIS